MKMHKAQNLIIQATGPVMMFLKETIFVQPEDRPTLTKFTLKAYLTAKTTKNISHQLLAH